MKEHQWIGPRSIRVQFLPQTLKPGATEQQGPRSPCNGASRHKAYCGVRNRVVL